MAKIGEKFTFVAQIIAKQEKEMGQTIGLKVKLKERDLKEFDWTSFSVSAFDGFQVKDFVKVEGFFTENTKGKYPYRNIETDTPIEKASESEWSLAPRANADGVIIPPQPGQSAGYVPTSSPPGGTSSSPNGRNGESPGQRMSIERQSSINAAAKVCDIIASNYSEYYIDLTQVLTHAEENLPAFLRLAGSLYDYYSNTAATASAQQAQPTTHTSEASRTKVEPPEAFGGLPLDTKPQERPFEPPKLEQIGHVLNGALKRWGHTADKVCKFFGVDSAAEIGNSYTMSEAWEALKANFDGPDGLE